MQLEPFLEPGIFSSPALCWRHCVTLLFIQMTLTFFSGEMAPSTSTPSSHTLLSWSVYGLPVLSLTTSEAFPGRMVLHVLGASNSMQKAVSHMHKRGEKEPDAFFCCGKLCTAELSRRKSTRFWELGGFVGCKPWHQEEPTAGFQSVHQFLQRLRNSCLVPTVDISDMSGGWTFDTDNRWTPAEAKLWLEASV